MIALHEMTATDLAARIRTGEVSSREVIESHLDRIARVNRHVHAITRVLVEEARSAADAADGARRTGRPLGPLHGVPFTVKESIDCLGTPTTHGVPALRTALPYVDAPSVARLKAAGAILLGRTNMSELGMRLCSDNPLHGRTLNPRRPPLTAGGSSAGDAVAVATGMTPIGLGSDIGGSLRLPACFCGVAALKPTTGRIPWAASLPPHDQGMAGQAMLALGPMTRSVADLQLCLSILAGRDRRDPRSVDVPLAGPPPEERRLALLTESSGAVIPPATRAAIERAGELAAAAGWIVEEATPPEMALVGELWHKLIATDLSAVMPLSRPVTSPALYEYVMRLCRAAKLDEVSNHRLHEERSRLMREWSGFFADYPVAIGPNVIGEAWLLDADLEPHKGSDMLRVATQFILPASALGLPSVALPMGIADGLPVGIQVLSDLWREDLCLEVAELVERGAWTCRPIEPATCA